LRCALLIYSCNREVDDVLCTLPDDIYDNLYDATHGRRASSSYVAADRGYEETASLMRFLWALSEMSSRLLPYGLDAHTHVAGRGVVRVGWVLQVQSAGERGSGRILHVLWAMGAARTGGGSAGEEPA
jgi:hypothetical protein